LRSFEFLGTAEDWTRVWTQRERQTVSLRFYPYSFFGATALAADACAAARRKLRSRRTRVVERSPDRSTDSTDGLTDAAAGSGGPRRISAVQHLKTLAKAPLYAVARIAARSYIAGDRLEDALAVARRLRGRDLLTTLGYWDGPNESADKVLAAYSATIDAIAATEQDAYLSIKLPSLNYSHEVLAKIGRRARELGVRLHFDAMAPESVDRTWQTIIDSLPAGSDLGCTLPARWQRSAVDADWAVENRMAVRVVKGQWPDPERDVEPIAGYLAIVDRLAGRARAVAIATHNAALAEQSLQRLHAAGTPVMLELLYGLPSRRLIEIARRLGVRVRVYVPFGSAYLPYCLGELKKNPRIAWWLLRDAIRRP
jgi:proline dehydrogenase